MMSRRIIAAATGLVSGLIMAVVSIELVHVDRFALTPARILLGYIEAAALGAAVALASRMPSLDPMRRAVLGGSLGLGLILAARTWPTPWVNLYAFGAGGGPAGELPMIAIPLCALVLATGFFWDVQRRGGVSARRRGEEWGGS